jgi:diaminohydroxyphosphoribosylaminopyrimidine deaminase/5-amino-6-(5-phosphoribosylamino)uracil reductase
MDGRTAASDGSSQWISCEDSREDVHRLRAGSCAVVTGMGTVHADNPRLNARLTEPIVQPLRVIIDSTGQLSTKAALFDVDGSVLVASANPRRDKGDAFDSRTETITLPDGSGRVDLAALIDELGRRGCNEVLVEAGAGVAGAFAAAGLIDELLIYLAPDLLGLAGRGMFALPEVVNLENRLRFEISEVKQLGRDLRINLRPGCRET